MPNRFGRNDVVDETQDIQDHVNQLADSLEDVLKSWGSDVKGEADTARRKAQALLKESRARLHGRSRSQQAACDYLNCASTYVRDKPWQSLGAVAAVGIFVGALLSLRR